MRSNKIKKSLKEYRKVISPQSYPGLNMCKLGKFSSPPQYLKLLIMTLLDRNPKFTEYFSCLCMNKMALASKESAIQYALNVHFPIISVLGVIFHPLF